MSTFRRIARVRGPTFDPRRGQMIVEVLVKGKDRSEKRTLARDVMEVHLKRDLRSDEAVVHKDGNLLNDAIENLEVVPLTEAIFHSAHWKNAAKRKTDPPVTLTCGRCGKTFQRSALQHHHSMKRSRGTYCSKQCSGAAARGRQRPRRILGLD